VPTVRSMLPRRLPRNQTNSPDKLQAATGKQLKAAMLVPRTNKGPRKKRTRPEPRQYTVVDLERARDRVAAAERRIENDRSANPNRGRAGLKRTQRELSAIESQLRFRGLLE
jgi:hypothetical protein